MFFGRMYRGRNMVLSAAGHLDHASFLKQVETAFGALPEGQRQAFPDAPTTEARQVVQEKDLEQVHLVVGTVAPPPAVRSAMSLCSTPFSGQHEFRLFQGAGRSRLRHQSYLVPYQDTGISCTPARRAG